MAVPIELVGNPDDVVNAINGFDAGYHLDYLGVMEHRRSYFEADTLSVASAMELATALDTVLRNWGAGTRKSPSPRSIAQIARALVQASVVADLRFLLCNGIKTLSLARGTRCGAAGTAAVPEHDAVLVRVLNTLSADVFANNTNVTYPMKALLLLSGYMPAFDSQVRRGLQRGGFVGMDQTRMLMPTTTAMATYKKVTRLPYFLGDCWALNPTLQAGAALSNYPMLQQEPGRVFDVLLFMQASGDHPVLLQWNGDPQCAWYDIP